jgi:hypothetical protein
MRDEIRMSIVHGFSAAADLPLPICTGLKSITTVISNTWTITHICSKFISRGACELVRTWYISAPGGYSDPSMSRGIFLLTATPELRSVQCSVETLYARRHDLHFHSVWLAGDLSEASV